jgi:mannosyltransferase OCH1-like enzyme
MAIPKIIHYCWFGRNPLPDDYRRYMDSWKTQCPDYEIVEWNEDNFDVTQNTYCREAYEAKKWAFVSDYARLAILCEYGGIYTDADVECLKPLDDFLELEAFSGFNSPTLISSGVMACQANFLLYREFLEYYDERHFIKKDGTYDTTPNTIIMTHIANKHGLAQASKQASNNNRRLNTVSIGLF